MSATDPSALALFWIAVIGVAILAYVVLDGFDLGVGILFGATKDAALRDEMIASISPFWDGNETWLIVVGATLFAAFPTVYAVFLGAFYIPVLLLLLALIFRGVAFEFRARGAAQGFWDRSFAAGSLVAAFVQGAAVGAMIRGVPVVNGQFSGGSFDGSQGVRSCAGSAWCLVMPCWARAGWSLSPKIRYAAGRAVAYRCLPVRLLRSCALPS
jgi:cytochrome d ubiquinol oxidase subunit II